MYTRPIAPLRKTLLPPEWSIIRPPGFDAVYWTFEDYPHLMCNGLRISDSYDDGHNRPDSDFDWPIETRLNPPNIAVLDGSANLPLTIQRYDLSNKLLSFIAKLSYDVSLSFIAHALVCGPASRTEAHVLGKQSKPHPLVMYEDKGDMDKAFCNSLLPWCSSSRDLVPADPWFYSLLGTDACLVFGGRGNWSEDILTSLKTHEGQAILSWNKFFGGYKESLEILLGDVFSKRGFYVLGKGDVIDAQMLISFPHDWELLKKITNVFEYFDHQKFNWREITPEQAKSKRQYFALQTATATGFLPSDRFIEVVELYVERANHYDEPAAFYVWEIKTRPSNPKPETLLAKIWNECLGHNPIPFDPEARRKLIEGGRRHPELNQHIEAWEEMKRTGSKWVFGGAKD
jgi:hypothetical protein